MPLAAVAGSLLIGWCLNAMLGRKPEGRREPEFSILTHYDHSVVSCAVSGFVFIWIVNKAAPRSHGTARTLMFVILTAVAALCVAGAWLLSGVRDEDRMLFTLGPAAAILGALRGIGYFGRKDALNRAAADETGWGRSDWRERHGL